MKIVNILLVIVLCVFLLGCTEAPIGIPDEMKVCQESEECIPFPGELDTAECINYNYADSFEKAAGHSTHFKEGAVYLPEHCRCLQEVCTNKALVPEILPEEA